MPLSIIWRNAGDQGVSPGGDRICLRPLRWRKLTGIRHHIEAGLDVPVRLAIYEHPDDKTRLVFNKPSSLMNGLRNVAVQDAAYKLDAKMMALGEAVTGAKA